MAAADILEIVNRSVPGAAEIVPAIDMPVLRVDRDRLVDVCRALKSSPDLQFALLVDVTAVDRLPAEPRFEVVYLLAALGATYVVPEAEAGRPAPPRRVRLVVPLPGEDARVPTVTTLWAGANWLEREVFDLFGIAFDGHPDLRRVLMPDDWQGHPLRKDYPVQIRKDAAAWSPLMLSPEEFAASVRARQAQADQAARRPPRTDDE